MHPNAYLKNIRNITSGVAARSKVLTVLDTDCFSAQKSLNNLPYPMALWSII
jgi:hypothetical protein